VFHLVSYKWFRRTRNIPELGLDYNVCGDFDLVVFWGVFVLDGGYCFIPDELYLTRKMS
jgi:hypothetical protein